MPPTVQWLLPPMTGAEALTGQVSGGFPEPPEPGVEKMPGEVWLSDHGVSTLPPG